jgi:hypothetical protein
MSIYLCFKKQLKPKNKYVVIDIERYKHMRALELNKTKKDIEAGRYKTYSAEEHIEELRRELQNNVDFFYFNRHEL